MVPAYILAGGKSSRMGEDKGLKLLHGKPLMRYVIDSLTCCFDEIKISTNNPEYKKLGYELVADIIPEKGPMGGIYSALKDAHENEIFVVSCDMPCISVSSVKELLRQKNKSATVAVHKGKIQPLFGIYSRILIPVLEKKIEKNELKMIDFLQEIKATFIEIKDDIFMNINTLEDFKQLENKK